MRRSAASGIHTRWYPYKGNVRATMDSECTNGMLACGKSEECEDSRKVYNEGHGNVVNENEKHCRDRGMVGECLGLAWGPVSVIGWIVVVIICERGKGLVRPCSGLGAIRVRGCGKLLVRVRCDAVVRMRPYGVRHGCNGKGDVPSTISSSELL